MIEYHAVFSIDTEFFRRLDGKYEVEGFVLRPCLITPRNQHTGSANFALEFNFYGLDERTIPDSSEQIRRSFVNMWKAGQTAKDFIAWFVLATQEWARLSSQSFGHSMRFGPNHHALTEDFDEIILERVFHVDPKAKDGEFFNVERPTLSFGISKDFKSLKLPSDFPYLTKKMLSLKQEKQERFLNACFSYQFALENWISYPTVSILSLVSAVESMMADEYTSAFCKDANKSCPLKKDVVKRFRSFFERNLQYPLPKELRNFLNNVYSKRSTYVHKALLGEGEARGIQFGYTFGEIRRLRDEQGHFEKLVNAALMEWIQRI